MAALSLLGRAQLLVCLNRLPATRHARLADALGFREMADETATTGNEDGSSPSGQGSETAGKNKEVGGAGAEKATELPQSRPQARFYRVTHRKPAPAETTVTDEPDWYRNARPYPDDAAELLAPSGLRPEAQPLLLPWSRLWPFLKLVLGAWKASRQPDVPKVVAALANGRQLRRLPRRHSRGWATQAQILIDFADPLTPFWSDFHSLRQQLATLRGHAGLAILAFPEGDPAGACWQWHPRVQGWRTLDRYRPPAPATPVLILSDLGCNDPADTRRRRWRRLGAACKNAGVRPVALMPTPARWRDRELGRLFLPVGWDRSAALPRRLGQSTPAVPAKPARDPANGERLLSLLAPAIRVEPALLRAVRRLFPAREMDVGAEALAWNHAAVHAVETAFYFDAERAEPYRARFRDGAAWPAGLREKTVDLIQRHHAWLSPAIGHEERLNTAHLMGEAGPDDARVFAERLAKTLRETGGVLACAGREWIGRVGGRRHGALWRDDALAAAWVSANAARLAGEEAVEVPDGLDLDRVAWALQQTAQTAAYVIRQRGEALHFDLASPDLWGDQEGWFGPDDGGRDPRLRQTQAESASGAAAAHAARRSASGSPLTYLRSSGDVVRIERNDAGITRRFLHPARQPVPLNPDLRAISGVGGDELRVESIERPTWASAIGRDSHGLWVQVAATGRRAYWISPRGFPVPDRRGEIRFYYSFDKGYWCDAEPALPQLRDGLQWPVWAHDFGLDEYGVYADLKIGRVVQRFRWIAPGEFAMGSPSTEAERDGDEIPHPVVLTRGFWLADTACTQALWQAVMGSNPSRFQDDAENPVEQVSWNEVQEFLARLNGQVEGLGARLPTEAEWEYGCRAGTATPFWFGHTITPEQVNYDGNHPYAGGAQGLYRQRTVPVKALPANGWGLYQMHGNVWEWCADGYGAYGDGEAIDPVGPAASANRVLRGGSWFSYGRHSRSACRLRYVPGYRNVYIGFRLALGPGASPAREAAAAGRAAGAEPGGQDGSGSRDGGA
jgi:hypothetical protein